MLETKNLVKIYRPKKGEPVRALDGVSLKFPEKGLVFLLGKSGSGKSTLLNVLGGLDRYDEGEILIKGASSRRFKQNQFDSYRNTYLGFIFQEYNLLDDFTVGANIGLALRLQGKKVSSEVIGDILRQVDLEGFGARKPSELSGGQKQRVAIARALVKNPEIIMADEPTGALDSKTGRQVLDTLKKLSADKLVIVVSHDREFAESYADRIIELADGKVKSDMEYDGVGAEGLTFKGESIGVPKGYTLTETDIKQINEYIAAIEQGVTLDLGQKAGARPTDLSKIREWKNEGLKLIRSKLPWSHAFKMGGSALGYKKFRLVITVLLSCIAFGLFGLADTFGAYNHINTCTDSIIDSNITYASVVKEIRWGNGDEVWYNRGPGITETDLKNISAQSGVTMRGVYRPTNTELTLSEHYNTEAKFTETDHHIYASHVTGFAEIDGAMLSEFGYTLTAGRLPHGNRNEIAISEYIAKTFLIGGYRLKPIGRFATLSSSKDLIGKALVLGGEQYHIVGIVDTGLDIERYKPLTQKKEGQQSTADQLLDFALSNELHYLSQYSLHQAALVGVGRVEQMVSAAPKVQELGLGHLGIHSENEYISPSYATTLENVPAEVITWLDGAKSGLTDKEFIVATDLVGGAEQIQEMAKEKLSLDRHIFNSEQDMQTVEDIKIVGYIDTSKHSGFPGTVIANAGVLTGMVYQNDGPYNFAVGNMPREEKDIKALVGFCYGEGGETRYPLMNAATYQLDTVNEALKRLSKVFLYIGLGFALFAALLLANFITISISYKKREIGILRAIGSRSADVFRIFFSESFIIAMINFVLSSLGVLVATLLVNSILRSEMGIYITMLHFSLRQVLLLFGTSCLVAAIASFLPVRRIAAKKPIDAIRDR